MTGPLSIMNVVDNGIVDVHGFGVACTIFFEIHLTPATATGAERSLPSTGTQFMVFHFEKSLYLCISLSRG